MDTFVNKLKSTATANKLRSFYKLYKNSKLIDTRYLYRYLEQDHLKKVIAEYQVDCVFDVGANIGQYATMLRMDAGYRGLIISFEPIPEAASILRQKAKDDPKWIVVESALSSTNGEQTLNIMNKSVFSSLSTPRHDELDWFKDCNQISESVTVITETLESAYSRLERHYGFKRPFLKLDCQGYDVEIVKTSQKIIGAFVGLQSELSVKKIYQHSVDFRDALALYEQCGLTLIAFTPITDEHFPVLVEMDCIMVREKNSIN